ncbi:Ig-like domain-containing protein [Streptomyces sp. NPDC001194]|uniref:Ig-like domain-containing protein n=1 Tax=Streptomyces sp. NPDC001194 TaxID=3364547 RepID=UPI0036A8CAF6
MNLLLRGQAVGDTPSLGTVYAALYTSADPRRGAAPGETVQFGLSVAPDGGASRGCAYLPEEPLAAVGEIVGVQGLEYFPRQRWFRARADAGEQTTGVLHLRVGDSVTARSIRPRLVVGIPDASDRKLVRTGKLAAEPLPLRPATPRGLRLVTEPGRPGTVNVLSAAAAGSTGVSVTQPRGGRAELSPDGWATYTPSPGFTGYDRFEYTVASAAAGQLTSHVNVFVGSLEHIPGAFPQHPADSAPRAWQWPELTGEMPWPRPFAPQN